MTLSVHQPNFVPWLGYFHKIARSDKFVILDQVQIPRGKSVANRNKIKTPSGPLEIVVPLTHPQGNNRLSSYLDVCLADQTWQKKALKTISYNYGKTPFFKEVFGLLEEAFSNESFCNMNSYFISEVCSRTEIKTPVFFQSQLNNIGGENNELIISICKSLGADVYLSGTGAAKYNDKELYRENEIELVYQDFKHPIYLQQHGEFISHLSVVDMLFNVGFNGMAKWLNEA